MTINRGMDKKDVCTCTFIAVFLTIAKRWKQPKCPSTNEWIKEIWYTYTMEYYSVFNKEKSGPHATPRMNLEDIMLRENKPVTKGQIFYDST